MLAIAFSSVSLAPGAHRGPLLARVPHASRAAVCLLADDEMKSPSTAEAAAAASPNLSPSPSGPNPIPYPTLTLTLTLTPNPTLGDFRGGAARAGERREDRRRRGWRDKDVPGHHPNPNPNPNPNVIRAQAKA